MKIGALKAMIVLNGVKEICWCYLRFSRIWVKFSTVNFFFSFGTTARCGLWPVEQYPSIFSYLSPSLVIFSFLALEDLFLLPLSIFSWVFPYVSSLPVLE
jgi:hypothetical protein